MPQRPVVSAAVVAAFAAVVALTLAGCALTPPLAAAQGAGFDTVQVVSQDLGGGVHMLVGAGGNMGAFVGPDGVLLIDDQFAPLTPKITAALAKLSDRPLRFVLNTHWHGDHTGGNENLGRAGATIIAHDNVRRRLSVEQVRALWAQTVPAAPKDALPVITFSTAVTFHMNGDTVQVFHVPGGHTDGDAVVHFLAADVIHTGDLFFNGRYPVIDVDAGGSLAGMITAVDRLLPLVGPQTKLIPGHGPLAGRADLEAFRAMLVGVRDVLVPVVARAKTFDDVKAAAPTKAYDAVWARGSAAQADRFLRMCVGGMKRSLILP